MTRKLNGAARPLALLALGLLLSVVGARHARADGDTGYNSLGYITPGPRNAYIHQGFLIPTREKGTLTFEITGASPVLVYDSAGVTPTSGKVDAIEVSSGTSCIFTVFDSSSTNNVQGYGATGNRLTFPVIGGSSTGTVKDLSAFSPQFNRGLVGSLSAVGCQGYIHWSRNGGSY